MQGSSRIIIACALLFLPTCAFAADTPQYAECRKACAGDGLSCVNKCMEHSAPAPSNAGATHVIIVDGQRYDDYGSYNTGYSDYSGYRDYSGYSRNNMEVDKWATHKIAGVGPGLVSHPRSLHQNVGGGGGGVTSGSCGNGRRHR